jgi:hypothetical protein
MFDWRPTATDVEGAARDGDGKAGSAHDLLLSEVASEAKVGGTSGVGDGPRGGSGQSHGFNLPKAYKKFQKFQQMMHCIASDLAIPPPGTMAASTNWRFRQFKSAGRGKPH